MRKLLLVGDLASIAVMPRVRSREGVLWQHPTEDAPAVADFIVSPAGFGLDPLVE
jgi:hypothetical protein